MLNPSIWIVVPPTVPTPMVWMRTPAVEARRAIVAGSALARVLPVGDQHDRRVAVVTDVDVAGVVVVEIGQVDLDRLAGDGVQRSEDARRDRGATAEREVRDCGECLGVVGGRCLHDVTGLAEPDDPDADAGRLIADERTGEHLRHADPGGVDVGGGHAVGEVHVEDDGRRFLRERDGCHRPGTGDDEDGEGEGEQRERHVLANAPPSSGIR